MSKTNLIVAGIFFALGFVIGYWQIGGFQNNQVGDPTKIILESISAYDAVDSPLTVVGQAKGTWYFEASFPVEVRDNNNNVLGAGLATAQGDWMTEDFVTFEANVEFDPQNETSGLLVFIKDNPSGEPQFDDEVAIPVNF